MVSQLAEQKVVQLLEEISISQTLPNSRACWERIEGLVGNDPSTLDRLSCAEERKTHYLVEHLEKKFGSRPDGDTPPTTPGADSATAQNVQDKTSAASMKER